MAYSGENIAEHMVPLAPETVARIEGFYKAIGGVVISSEEGQLLSAFFDTDTGQADGIGYWQTDKPHRLAWFEHRDADPEDPMHLSAYNQGLRLPRLMDLVERPLVMPATEDVVAIAGQNSDILNKHMHRPLREHAGRLEFRFSDPFLYGIRIAGPKLAEVV